MFCLFITKHGCILHDFETNFEISRFRQTSKLVVFHTIKCNIAYEHAMVYVQQLDGV